MDQFRAAAEEFVRVSTPGIRERIGLDAASFLLQCSITKGVFTTTINRFPISFFRSEWLNRILDAVVTLGCFASHPSQGEETKSVSYGRPAKWQSEAGSSVRTRKRVREAVTFPNKML